MPALLYLRANADRVFAPVKADTATTNEDTAVVITAATVLGNDSDPENDTLTVTSVQTNVPVRIAQPHSSAGR